MMSADDEILQRAQPKGFRSNAGLTPDASSKKKNLSFSLRRVTPDKNDSLSTPTASGSKKLFAGRRGNNSGSGGRGRRGVRSIEKEQKMQDEYYEGHDDDDDNINNHEEEELDDGELPSLSPLARGSKLAPLSPPRGRQQPHSKNLMVEGSPAALIAASNSGGNRNVTPTSDRDYETLKVAGFWSQLDTADDDDSDSDYGRKKPNASSRAHEEEMPNDERQWRRSQSPPRNRAMAAAAATGSNSRTSSPANNTTMGLSLVQNTSSESTIRTEMVKKQGTGDDDESDSNGNNDKTTATGGWNLLEMARCFAAEHRLTGEEENEAAESQGLDRSYDRNARVVSPSNGNGDGTHKTGDSSGYGYVEEDEEEGIIENLCVQLGNICGLGGDEDTKSRAHSIIAKRKQRLGQYDDDGDSVFENLEGEEDVAIELGYVEPEEGNANVVSPKRKKKGWKSFLGIKKKSPPRQTLVTETTRSGREPVVGETTKVSDLNVAQTYSGNGLNPLDSQSAIGGAAAAAAVAGAGAAVAGFAIGSRSRSYADDDGEEFESAAAGWDAKRKNMYLRQLESQAKEQQRIASNSTEDDEDDDDDQEDTTIDRQDTPEVYTADYTNFSPSDKSKFLRFLNAGMSPQDATRAVIQEREAEEEEEEDIVSVKSEDPPGVRKGYSGESAELSARDEGDLEGLVEELENQPVSQSEMAHDSQNVPAEAYQDRATIPMVPAIVSAKRKSKSRQEGEGTEVEDQNGLASSGIQYYDAVSNDRNDGVVDDDSNFKKKRSIGRPRLSKPNLSSNIASSLAAKVASKRFDSVGKNTSKYGKVSDVPSASEEVDDAPSVPMVVSMPAPVEEEKVDSREIESTINEQSVDDDEVSSSKPKANVFDLMQRNRGFSKLESEVGFNTLPSKSAKSDEDDLPSWARSASRDAETVTSAFSPPIENMDDEQAEDNIASTEQQRDDDGSTPDDEITEYDEDTMSLMGQTFMTGASGYSRRRRRKGAANTRVASAKEAENHAGAKSKGWIGSIQEAASKNGQVWHPEKGWMNYNEPEEEHHDNENHDSIGRLHVPHNVSQKSLPPQAQAPVGGFTTPRSVVGTEFDDQSVVTRLTVNTAAEAPSILTTSTAPTRRAGRKPRPTDQRKIAAAQADKPIGWKDSMQNAANGVDNGGFRWDFEKGWIRIDGSDINDDDASALTESVFYNEGQDVGRSPPKSELLPVTEEDANEFSDDDEDVFNNIEQEKPGVSTKTVDYEEKYGVLEVDSDDSSEKENSHANKVNEEPTSVQERSNPFMDRIMAAEPEDVPIFSHAIEDEEEDDEEDEEDDASLNEISVQDRSNPFMDRIMAAEPTDVPVFSSPSADEIIREPSGLRASQFVSAQADEASETDPSRDPSGVRASQVNSNQDDPSGKASHVSSGEATSPPPSPKKSLNTWLESSKAIAPHPTNDTEASHVQEESVDAVKTSEPSPKTDSFNLESFEDEGVFGSTQVVKEKFSDTESDLFQPYESEIKKATFESFESQGSADNDWVSTTLKRQSPVTTSDEVSQKARVWMDSMQNDDETEESSESGSNEPQVNKADPPQSLDPPSANLDSTRIKKRPANSWIKAKDDSNDDEEPVQKEVKALPLTESNVGSLRSKFESQKNEADDENVVVFKSQAMGIRLKRGEDGFVRVVSVTQAAFGSSIDRAGAIEPGDTVKEAAGIDLRSPITNSQWGEAVTQIRNAPRPMTFIVAAGPERKSKDTLPKPVNSSTLPPAQASGGRNVVEYNLSKTSEGEQVVKSVREYRRHHSPERAGKVTPNRRQYGSPGRHSDYGSEHDSPDRSIYTEDSSVYSEDLPTKDSFFNRIAACATAGAAACAPGGAQQRSSDDGEKTQVPMAHLKFLRTNPTITRVTNAAKSRLNCGRPDTIFEEAGGDPAYDLGRSKSGASWTNDGQLRVSKTDNGSRADDQSKPSSVRAVQRTTTGDNTAFLENLTMNSPVTSKPAESMTEGVLSRPKLMVQSYSSGGGEIGWPDDNDGLSWPKDTIETVSTVSAHSSQKKDTALQAEMLASAKVEAMMEDLDHDEDSECEI